MLIYVDCVPQILSSPMILDLSAPLNKVVTVASNPIDGVGRCDLIESFADTIIPKDRVIEITVETKKGNDLNIPK